MNRLRQYRQPFLISLLVAVFVVIPNVVFAGDPVTEFFQKILWSILTTITGTILWICAMLFDFSVNTFVIGFGNLYLGSGIGVAVDRIWFILRDFVNMFFIFGLVYIGFKMILDADNSNTRRWLVNLIIAAILINFSLFITKAVVDFSNQLATQIAISGFPDSGVTQSTVGATPTVDLANGILGMMGIKDLLNLAVGDVAQGGWGYIFGTAIFFLVTAFVLAAGAFMLMIRFVALTLFMLVSPLMFVSWILPPISDTMNRYWKAFFGRAFFAPVYFLFIYFSLETLVGLQQSLNLSSGGGKWAKTFSATGAGGNEALAAGQSTLPYFFIMCGFMIGSLMVAKKLSADGADKAMDWGKSLKNKAVNYTKKGAGSATFGLAGKAGQATAGRLADSASKSRRFQNFAANNKLGRVALAGTRKVADSSFDARRVGGLGKSLGIGEGSKGGYQTGVKKKVERDEKFYKSLDDTDIKEPENAARVRAVAEAKSTEARQTKADAEGQITQAKNEQAVIAAMAEEGTKSTMELTTEITDLNKEIEGLSTALEAKVAAGTITTQERALADKAISDKTALRERKNLAKNEILAQKALQGQITRNGVLAASTIDPVEAARYREEKQRLQQEFDARRDMERRQMQTVATIEQAGRDIKTANASIEQSSKDAENEIKYENKVAYLKSKERDVPGYHKRNEDGSTTFVASGGAAAESANNLKKKFGGSAAEMAKKSTEKKDAEKLAKQLAQIQKDNAAAEKKEGGEEKKD